MSINISIANDLSKGAPSSSMYLHLCIICSALKYCRGASKGMTYSKLAYIFDKTIILDENAITSFSTLKPWFIGGDFKKSLVIAESQSFVLFEEDQKAGMKISNTDKGNEYVSSLENMDVFQNYISYLKRMQFTEKKFEKPLIRC